MNTTMPNTSSGQADEKGNAWFFDGPSGVNRAAAWRWWSQRRWRYNRDLFFVGTAAWLLVMIAGSAAVKPGEDFEEPLMMIAGPPLYAALANIAYTAGPILDAVLSTGSGPRKGLFKAGHVFSVVLTALPGL